MASREPRVWLIDAFVQIFRAYHSMPDLSGPDGQPVGAFRGYSASLLKFLARQQPTHVAVAWDHGMTSFRNRLYADYKLGRSEAPEDLEPQIPLCARFTRALGIPLFELEDFEADDVIATLTRRLSAEGARVAIVTTDKDLGALVSEQVSLFDVKRETHQGPAEVVAKFGVPPALVSDWLALAGDAVDNIPGARGIGGKTAAALLSHFGGIDQIPADFADWKALPLRGAARAHRALAESSAAVELSRELAALRYDLPLEPELADLEYHGALRADLEALLEETGATQLLARVPRFRD
jgi:5'-3' exonuclease